jgi:transposase
MRFRIQERRIRIMNPRPNQQLISREEILAVYQQGEAAVIDLVEGILKKTWELELRIQVLEDRLKKDSRNSSKPPSGDGFGKRTKSLRTKSDRKSGGQTGHEGSTLEWREEVDETIIHPVEHCEACGGSLAATEVLEWDLRQVHDLPPLKLEVKEHQIEVKKCEHCGLLNRGKFPVDVSNVVQYGSGIKGLMVYLMEGQILPSERVSELLRDVFGCELSEGTLYNTREQCYEQLEVVEQHLKKGIQESEVVHFDETGMRVKGKLMWLHVASTSGLTYYFIHANRGQIAMDEMEILPNFEGISVHDGFSSYAHYDCEHGLCNAHHLRELLFVVERYEQPWADQMMALLIEIKDQVEIAKTAGISALNPNQLTDFEARYRELIQEGFKANPPPPIVPDQPKKKGRLKQSPPKNLLDRLDKNQSAVLAFMYDFRVTFDNNQAERDLRMMKLKQKVSGTFRSLEGAQMFCRIRGYISTLRKQGLNVLDALRQIFLGNPVFPNLQPE